jgi:acetoacetate decarboxylase
VGLSQEDGQPRLQVHTDTLVGELNYGPIRIATGSMGYKHRELDGKPLPKACAPHRTTC